LITISQFLAVPKRTSYDTSNCDFAVSLLKPRKAIKSVSHSVNSSESTAFSIPVQSLNLTESESNALCYLTGWIAFKLKAQLKSCDTCVKFVSSCEPDDNHLPQNQLTVIKSYGWLTLPSALLQKIIRCAEIIFQQNRAACLHSCDVLRLLLEKSVSLLSRSDPAIPNCHDVVLLALTRFYRIRAHICAAGFSKASKNEPQFASKSAKSRTTIK
jgi:hypothetical protein